MSIRAVDLHLDPNEASDLAPLFDAGLLDRRGWDHAFATVLDEAPAESAVAVLVHEAGADPDIGWHAHRVPGKADGPSDKTEDSEACARRYGWLYVVGSQFGSKEGPLQAKRSFVARVGEEALADWLDGGDEPAVEVARLRFGLHRAINDALDAAAVELTPLGAATRELYIDATIAHGAREGKRWEGRVKSGDHPINVEGAEFRGDGRLLVGNLDSTGKGATVLEDKPEAGRARSTHVRFSLPMAARGGAVAAEEVHRFTDRRRVEGLVVHGGRAFYVVDQDGRVALRTGLVGAGDPD